MQRNYGRTKGVWHRFEVRWAEMLLAMHTWCLGPEAPGQRQSSNCRTLPFAASVQIVVDCCAFSMNLHPENFKFRQSGSC